MIENKSKKINYLDWYIAIPSLLLALFGIVNVYSASSNMASGSALSYLIKQVIFAAVGIGSAAFMFSINLDHLRNAKIRRISIRFLIFLLLVARFVSPEINGAHGWIMLAGFGLQPAEFAKVLLVLYFANFFERRPYDPNRLGATTFNWQKWVWPALIVGIIFLMPDNGNAAICSFIILVMLVSVGFNYLWALGMFLAGIIGWAFLPLLVKALHIDPTHYTLARLVAFVNPWEYIQTSGAQLINSYYAISNGGLFGVGLGNSIQKTGYLPEPNTDFIMAVIAEEWGAVVVVLILAMLAWIIGRMVQLSNHTDNVFMRTILMGASAYITIQVLFNLGAVSGLLPITGVTFPFMSYGGSSALVIGTMIGLALNASATINRQRDNGKLKAVHA